VYEDCISHMSERNISNNLIDKDISIYEICNENRDHSDNLSNVISNNSYRNNNATIKIVNVDLKY